MSAFKSDRHQNDPVHSQPTSALPSPGSIFEPPKTVLVVEDEREVRDLETEILRLRGYAVLEAASVAEALRLAGETATIHLLITDLMMPEVDGLELTRRFRSVHPNTPVLVVSGSLPLFRARCEQELDRVEFVAKPFQFDELLHKVRTLLDTAASLPI